MTSPYRQTQHHHVKRTDEEIDAIKLAYQEACVTQPLYLPEARFEQVLELLDPKHAKLKRFSPGTMRSCFSDLGLTEKYNPSVESDPMWAAAHFGSAEYKVLFRAWRTSCECIAGRYRAGKTEDVDRIVWDGLQQHIDDLLRRWKRRPRKHPQPAPTLEGVDIFRLRCLLGCGTTAECRKAGFEPGCRRTGMLKRTVEQHFSKVPTVGERIELLEQQMAELQAAQQACARRHAANLPC